MKTTVIGCSPSFQSSDGHCSSYLVQHENTNLLIDCGHGSLGALRSVLDFGQLTAILLSHMHPDHFFDLVPLRYAYRFRDEEAGGPPLWLPPGGASILDSLTAPLDFDEDFFTGTYRIREYNPIATLTIGDLEVRFAHTTHFVPAYAMRLTPTADPSRALFFSSDTAPNDAVAELASNAPLAFVEATQLRERPGKQAGHLTGELAGGLAKEAKVGRLVLTHYMEELAEELLMQARSTFQGSVEMARELQTYEV
jgi:ribonuclease BN (tRNA processing enzyme)